MGGGGHNLQGLLTTREQDMPICVPPLLVCAVSKRWSCRHVVSNGRCVAIVHVHGFLTSPRTVPNAHSAACSPLLLHEMQPSCPMYLLQGLGLPAVKGDISAPTTSLRPPSATPGRLAPPLTSAAASDADAVGGTAKEEEPEMEGKMASVAMDVSANPKLRAALGKALEYRRAKAHTTAQGAAIAAASAARSRPVASQG